MNILSLFKAPPESFDVASAHVPESAIAYEVEMKIHALSVLCRYVGWSDVEKHLDLARKELRTFLKQEGLGVEAAATAPTPAPESALAVSASNVTPLKTRSLMKDVFKGTKDQMRSPPAGG